MKHLSIKSTNKVISKELSANNAAYLSMVFSGVLKEFEETGKVKDKRSWGNKRLSAEDEQYLKVMSLAEVTPN